jgi:hypothetical protein
MNTNKVIFKQWTAELIGKELHVSNSNFPTEKRIYDIPQKNEGIEYDTSMPEYMYIRTKGFYYNFKFEEADCFVGDKFTNDNELMDEIACHTFGEDVVTF